jgi:hypothetical protein
MWTIKTRAWKMIRHISLIQVSTWDTRIHNARRNWARYSFNSGQAQRAIRPTGQETSQMVGWLCERSKWQSDLVAEFSFVLLAYKFCCNNLLIISNDYFLYVVLVLRIFCLLVATDITNSWLYTRFHELNQSLLSENSSSPWSVAKLQLDIPSLHYQAYQLSLDLRHKNEQWICYIFSTPWS